MIQDNVKRFEMTYMRARAIIVISQNETIISIEKEE